MAKPKASETDPKPKQDAASEAERERLEQEQRSEAGGESEQEREAREAQEGKDREREELKASLLTDESFLDSIAETEPIRRRTQSQRDGQLFEMTLPMKQQIEQLEAKLDAATTANDPVRVRYLQLKEAGHYEEALNLLEERQRMADGEATAVARGRREGAQETLQGIAARPEFASLTQEDWRQVYADAAAEAGQAGRNYITVEEYTGHATRLVVAKEKGAMGQQTKEERDKEIKEEVDAQLKAAGVKRREKEGGPEEEGDETPAGGEYTMEQLSRMTRAQLAKVPREKRHRAMAGGTK